MSGSPSDLTFADAVEQVGAGEGRPSLVPTDARQVRGRTAASGIDERVVPTRAASRDVSVRRHRNQGQRRGHGHQRTL
jgi:hypothetical protein